eukprot:s8448_g2.t1
MFRRRDSQRVRPGCLCIGTVRKRHCNPLDGQSTDGHLQEKCGFTVKDATVAHLNRGTSPVQGFQDNFGTALPLARSLEHILRNIQKV